MADPRSPSRATCFLIGLAAAALAFRLGRWFCSDAACVTDVDLLWYGARTLAAGGDAYAATGPGGGYRGNFPMFYPATTLVAFLPLSTLPLEVARRVFGCTAAFLFAYAALRSGWHRLPIFVSGPFLHAVLLGQWSPLFAAAWLMPGLACIAFAKPNMGIVLLAATPARRTWVSAFGGGILLAAVSLLLDPAWPARWLALLQTAPHFTPPVLLPGGFLILLGLLRWRRPEARLLLAMACVPHTTVAYEMLLVLLTARNWREAWLLSGLSMVVTVLQYRSDVRVTGAPAAESSVLFAQLAEVTGGFAVAFLYLPAVLLLLLRPNEGPIPAWLAFLGRASSHVRVPFPPVAAKT